MQMQMQRKKELLSSFRKPRLDDQQATSTSDQADMQKSQHRPVQKPLDTYLYTAVCTFLNHAPCGVQPRSGDPPHLGYLHHSPTPYLHMHHATLRRC